MAYDILSLGTTIEHFIVSTYCYAFDTKECTILLSKSKEMATSVCVVHNGVGKDMIGPSGTKDNHGSEETSKEGFTN